jgi:aminomethyltransferase
MAQPAPEPEPDAEPDREPGTDSPVPTLRRSPLHDRHVALGARLADFSGWQMPLQYAGVVEEHVAVRERVGVFDVSHLGKITVHGRGARAFVNRCLTNDLSRIAPGQAQYTLCCNEHGGVVDDLIAYLRADDEVFLVPNAANTAELAARLAAAAPPGVHVVDQHEAFAILAVQGPRSDDVLDAIGLPHDLGYMAFGDLAWRGVALTVCRTGYTGERGYELVVPWGAAGRLWDAVTESGGAAGLQPCGLGARDTLRTEMGYPLHGQDLSPTISPVQARSGWAVGWTKPQFWGRDALLDERASGPQRLLRGLEAVDRGIPRPGMHVRTESGDDAGTVTSGTFSPTRRLGIGLALLEPRLVEGAQVIVDVRGRESRFKVVRPPFVQPSTH